MTKMTLPQVKVRGRYGVKELPTVFYALKAQTGKLPLDMLRDPAPTSLSLKTHLMIARSFLSDRKLSPLGALGLLLHHTEMLDSRKKPLSPDQKFRVAVRDRSVCDQLISASCALTSYYFRAKDGGDSGALAFNSALLDPRKTIDKLELCLADDLAETSSFDLKNFLALKSIAPFYFYARAISWLCSKATILFAPTPNLINLTLLLEPESHNAWKNASFFLAQFHRSNSGLKNCALIYGSVAVSLAKSSEEKQQILRGMEQDGLIIKKTSQADPKIPS